MPDITVFNLLSSPQTIPGGYYPQPIPANSSATFDVPDIDEFVEEDRIQALITAGHIRWESGTIGATYNQQLVAFGGGAATTTATVPGVLATDIVLATLNASTNAVYVEKAVRTAADTVTITFSADPGAATTVALVVYRNA